MTESAPLSVSLKDDERVIFFCGVDDRAKVIIVNIDGMVILRPKVALL